MKNYKQILEAVNRGVQLALDDFDDEEQVQNIKSKQVYNRDYTKEYIDLMKEVVDLGLPSRTLWCKYNLGATCKSNYEQSWYGNYYAWGELEPNKKKYDFEHYRFCNCHNIDDNTAIEHYITKYGIDEKHLILLPEDDAAYQFKKCHNFKFHIPTTEQAQELIDNTKVIYVKNIGKEPKYEDAKGYTGAGWIFISKINENYLFFPETGIKDDQDGIRAIPIGPLDSGVWTSKVFNKRKVFAKSSSPKSKAKCAFAIKLSSTFNQEYYGPQLYGFYKYRGLQIRPVVNL